MNLEQELMALDRAALKARWCEVVGMAPPPRLGRGTMVRILCCEIQWRESGKNRAAVLRELQRALRHAEEAKPVAGEGARLVRVWNGRRHVVDVTSTGYVWQGQSWASLSAIAREITGTRWSGPRFFGVTA